MASVYQTHIFVYRGNVHMILIYLLLIIILRFNYLLLNALAGKVKQ